MAGFYDEVGFDKGPSRRAVLLPGETVVVFEDNAGALTATVADLFSDELLATPKANPFTSDSLGNIAFWADATWAWVKVGDRDARRVRLSQVGPKGDKGDTGDVSQAQLDAHMAQIVGAPPSSNTIHAIGDIHMGAISELRKTEFLADMATLPTFGAHVQAGDLTQNSLTAEDTAVRALLDQLKDPWFATLGNHDLFGRTGAVAAASLGITQNASYDLGFAQLIIVSPDAGAADNLTIVLSAATIAWLDAELAAVAPKPAIICSHAPLWNTHLGTPDPAINGWSSTGFFGVVGVDIANLTNGVADKDIRAVLQARPNAKVWLSGHIHPPITNPTLVLPTIVGNRAMAAINASALYYTGQDGADVSDLLASLFVTLWPNRVDVRFREHALGEWYAPNGQAISTVELFEDRTLEFLAASSQRVEIPAFNAALPDPNVLTIEAWIYPYTQTARMGIFSLNPVWMELGSNAGGSRLAVSQSPFTPAIGPDGDIPNNAWTHVAYTRSGIGTGTHKLYKNGVEVVGGIYDGGNAVDFVASTSTAKMIGGRTPGALQPFNGRIRNVRVWSVARSQAEIAANKDLWLRGDETGLVGYWPVNDGVGTGVRDEAKVRHPGATVNGPVWVKAT